MSFLLTMSSQFFISWPNTIIAARYHKYITMREQEDTNV
jgi:hypothetical protein